MVLPTSVSLMPMTARALQTMRRSGDPQFENSVSVGGAEFLAGPAQELASCDQLASLLGEQRPVAKRVEIRHGTKRALETGRDRGSWKRLTPTPTKAPASFRFAGTRRTLHEHDYYEGWHADLLQGLGEGPGRDVLPRLASELRHVGRTNALPRAERLSRGCARPTWPWPVQSGLVRQRHERLCRRSCGSDRSARSQGSHAGGPLHRRRRGRALYRPPRDEPSRQGRPDRRGATAHAENRGQSRGAADRAVRRPAREPRQGPLADLQGFRSPVLWRQQARCQGLARRARSVLALEHAVRSQERVRKHQGLLRDRFHRGPQEVRCTDFGASRRGRPDRSGEELRHEVSPTHQGREGRLLSERAARPHRHASGPGQPGTARLHQGGQLTMLPTAEPTIMRRRARVLGGVTVVDTPLVTRAMDLARKHSEPFLFNHAVRSWLFAVRLGQLLGISHDEEVVAVGSLLHDLGLTNGFTGHKRFEIER